MKTGGEMKPPTMAPAALALSAKPWHQVLLPTPEGPLRITNFGLSSLLETQFASGEAGENFLFDHRLSFPIPPPDKTGVSGGRCVSAAALLLHEIYSSEGGLIPLRLGT